MSEKYVFICPKCGQVEGITYPHGTIVNCCFCETQLLETSLTLHESAEAIRNGTIEIIDRKLFEQYVKNNPLYDQNEAELSKLKRETNKIANEMRYAAERAVKEANKPHCPVCNSTNVERIGAVRKGVSIAVFGLFSGDIGKTMVCNNCGYKF